MFVERCDLAILKTIIIIIKIKVTTDRGVHRFETRHVLSRDDGEHDWSLSLDDIDHVKPKEHDKERDEVSVASSIVKYPTYRFRRTFKYVVCAVVCTVTLYGVVVILSEVGYLTFLTSVK